MTSHPKRNTSLGQFHYNTVHTPSLVTRIAAHSYVSEKIEKDHSRQWQCKCNRWHKRRKESFCPFCKESYE